jgi:protein SCO1
VPVKQVMESSAKTSPRLGGGKKKAESRARLALTLPFLVGILAFLATLYCIELSRISSEKYIYYGEKIRDPGAPFDFKLTDQENRPFQLHNLRRKVVLITFGFTHCPNICPTTLGNLATVYRNLPPKLKDNVQVVFVSVDPERDTPRSLKEYVPFFNPSFIGLTGTPSAIESAGQAFGVFYHRTRSSDSKDYSIDHSTDVYLIDPAGKLSVVYEIDKINAWSRMVEDIQHVLSVTKAAKS